MLFNSFIYFIFLGLVLPVFYSLPTKNSKNIFLLFVSYFFYGYWDWRFCSLLAISTMIDYTIAKKIDSSVDPKIRKRMLVVSMFVNLAILGIFKYFNFFIEGFQDLSNLLGWRLDYLHLNILLPVGISFYTFQTMSYTIDVYRKELKPTNNFIDFALFVAFFPQLVAGPIERAKALLPQLSKKLSPNLAQIKEGIVLIITGLFIKVMIGDTAGRYVDHIFGNLAIYKSIEILSALILFSIQIYADFSGYSSIARGTAKLLGVELMINFEQPYLSKNITEFWRRWHISLSSWLRDYLYISLGGNRTGNYRTYINLMTTMILGGLWHGASWNFVIWGGLHGLYLSIHKMILGKKKTGIEKIDTISFRNIFNVMLTYLLVLITWIFFRSKNWDSTKLFFSKILQWESSEHSFLFLSVVSSYLIVILIFDILMYKTGSQSFLLNIKSNGIKLGLLLALVLVTFIYMFQADPAPFIYFQF